MYYPDPSLIALARRRRGERAGQDGLAGGRRSDASGRCPL